MLMQKRIVYSPYTLHVAKERLDANPCSSTHYLMGAVFMAVPYFISDSFIYLCYKYYILEICMIDEEIVPFLLRIPKQLLTKLENLAKQERRSTTAQIRKILEEKIK
jgi:hypothetical protein